MKSMIFMCISLVIMAGIARVYMAGGIDGLIGGSGSDVANVKLPSNVGVVTTDRNVEVYKWRDENGVLHFGESAPLKNVAVEKIQLRTNENVMDATSLRRQIEKKRNASSQSNSTIKQVNVSNPYSPQGMADMISQTKELTSSISKQAAERDKMMRGLTQQ